MNGRLDRATVFVDADNTLWDTDAVFAESQLALLEAVEAGVGRRTAAADRLAFLRAIDQALAERHHARLRYPPRLLVRATELALGGIDGDSAARAAWRGGQTYRLSDDQAGDIERRFFENLAHAPEIRPGVLIGLSALEQAGCLLLIVTEGAKAKVERNAERVGVAQFFERIIEGPKAPELYRRVLSFTGAPARAFMVGDQLDRDITPAKTAGLGTIFFPGGFQPRWTPAVEQVRPDYTIASFDEVPDIVLGQHRATAAGSKA